jgi:hypothetical protein
MVIGMPEIIVVYSLADIKLDFFALVFDFRFFAMIVL